MYIAELKGKLSSKTEYMEDILTSNIFSFFKYANRKIFLKPFLNSLGFSITSQEAEEAEFIFWPRFEDGTEPDFVLVVSNYYILFEAKYFSDFGKDQLKKEADGGRLAAENLAKQFHLIAITADYSEPKEKFKEIRKITKFRWINWHFIASFLEKKLMKDIPDSQFAEDLHSLLIKKNLRIFDGYLNLFLKKAVAECRFAFFDYISAKYRGTFIGFLEPFSYWKKKIGEHKTLFFETKREFSWIPPRRILAKVNNSIFFGG